MTAPKQVPVTRDDLGYEPKHRAESAREWSALVDPPTRAQHVDGSYCRACDPKRYALRAAKHRAEVAS
jgi:hypothetical protein